MVLRRDACYDDGGEGMRPGDVQDHSKDATIRALAFSRRLNLEILDLIDLMSAPAELSQCEY